jgi:hypothetical protein
MPPVAPADDAETCPGCGSVLAVVTETGLSHPGASPSCARLFEVTVRGLREEATADGATAAVVRQADAAYDAQHPVRDDRARLRAALDRIGASPDCDLADGARPPSWRTTIADVAADLDVIDLPVLIASWADAIREDWSATSVTRS